MQNINTQNTYQNYSQFKWKVLQSKIQNTRMCIWRVML